MLKWGNKKKKWGTILFILQISIFIVVKIRWKLRSGSDNIYRPVDHRIQNTQIYTTYNLAFG